MRDFAASFSCSATVSGFPPRSQNGTSAASASFVSATFAEYGAHESATSQWSMSAAVADARKSRGTPSFSRSFARRVFAAFAREGSGSTTRISFASQFFARSCIAAVPCRPAPKTM